MNFSSYTQSEQPKVAGYARGFFATGQFTEKIKLVSVRLDQVKLGYVFFFFIFYSELSLRRTVLQRKILDPFYLYLIGMLGNNPPPTWGNASLPSLPPQKIQPLPTLQHFLQVC